MKTATTERSTLRVYAYSVESIHDAPCPQCGWEHDPGDLAFELADIDGATVDAGFCSRRCARLYAFESIGAAIVVRGR